MVINTMELAIMRNEFAQSRIWATLSIKYDRFYFAGRGLVERSWRPARRDMRECFREACAIQLY